MSGGEKTNKPYRFAKSASQALISIHARRSFARFAGPSKLVLSTTGACKASSPCPLFMRSRVNPMCRKASSLDRAVGRGDKWRVVDLHVLRPAELRLETSPMDR